MKPNEPEDVRAPRLKDRIAELLRLASSNEDGPSEDQVFGAVKALLNAVEPKSQPEDVQLDVEAARQFWGTFYGTGPEYADQKSCEFAVAFANSLRRVSGKGIQEPRYTAKEIISLIRSAEWEEEFMQADDESCVAFITGKLAQMTTQGTPEGPTARPVKAPPVPRGTCLKCHSFPCVCNPWPTASQKGKEGKS